MTAETELTERLSNSKEFEYIKRSSHDQIFQEVTVIVVFTIGNKDPRSFSGGTYAIKNEDEGTQEAESFLEAAKKAWNEKYRISEPETAKFVKEQLKHKWKELKGNKLTGKNLKF